MAKKADEAEIKKECPSCGLGVALDSKMCEFCGWDFDEEDEWILQIEKLERDLLLEKQKFEPGSVEDKIESTLRSPFFQKTEEQEAGSHPKSSAKPPQKIPPSPGPSVRETKASGVKVVKPVDTVEEPKPVIRTTTRPPAPPMAQTPKPAPAPAKPVASVREEPEVAPEAPKAQAQKTRRTRVVRKVKQA
ncbi:MAG: hypothetical protein A3K76_04420 [Euryarchaeota archaeon RBG_13_57_23]|nr:MAG: hypothetical protein A3K76_04420 [Euryarchaeota archaeon RBG_13_57_23]